MNAASRPRRAVAEHLRASPNFLLAYSFDGKPYVAKDSEPYIQYWLTERDRVLLALFGGRRGSTAADAIDAYYRMTQATQTPASRRSLSTAIRAMRTAGVLIGREDDTSRYDRAIAASYVRDRPFPRTVAETIIAAGLVAADSAVLDLAGGPGDLALALAGASRNVTLMELSHGFAVTARERAAERGLALTVLNDSCNRLPWHDGSYDVITVSQALHWLDDVQVCRGVVRLLRAGGSFFVVHAAFDVPDDHPLAYLFGRRSILGEKAERSFAAEVKPLLRRLALLFEALDTPDVDRADLGRRAVAAGAPGQARIAPQAVRMYRQRRPLGAGFTRAFLTPDHIARSGLAPAAFWADLEARCADLPAERFEGTYNWALLQFRRGVGHPALPDCEALPVTEIHFDGPTDP